MLSELDVQCIAWLARIDGSNKVCQVAYQLICDRGILGRPAANPGWYECLEQAREIVHA